MFIFMVMVYFNNFLCCLFWSGRCIGAIIGGMVSLQQPLQAVRMVYRSLGVVALVVAAVYLGLYHLLLAPRCAAPAVSPPHHLLQGKRNNACKCHPVRDCIQKYYWRTADFTLCFLLEFNVTWLPIPVFMFVRCVLALCVPN